MEWAFGEHKIFRNERRNYAFPTEKCFDGSRPAGPGRHRMWGEEGRTHISPRHRSGSCPGYTDSDATDSDTDNATPTDGRTDQSASDASADLGHA